MKYLNWATVLLAILKLTGLMHITWLIVFVPTIIYLGVLVLALLFVAFVFKTAGKEVLKAIQDELDD